MKTWLALLAALGLLSPEAEAPNRREAHLHAEREFLKLNFFSEGRGMHLSPGLIRYFNGAMKTLPAPGNKELDLRTWFTRRWGLNFANQQVVGLSDVKYQNLRVGAIGCVACHSGRAAGQLIVGLGNKNIDVVRMAKDVHTLESWWKGIVPALSKSEDYKDVEEAALDFASYLSNDRVGNLTQGLVPVSFIRGWFYRVHGEEMPEGMKRGQVKVPMLWGYEKKREAGQFCDGYGDGTEVGWAVAVELAAGQKPEAVRAYYESVKHAEELFNHFLPPPYPFAINQEKAERGRETFANTCARCHGTYEKDPEGYPIYQAPRFIPWKVVLTDPDRILGNTPEFNAMVERSPLADIIRRTNLGNGYFAPRLEGVWSRFPYLHNASVPNLAALLEKPENRPKVFSLKDSGEEYRFDKGALGLTLPSSPAEERSLLRKARRGDRSVYDTSRTGHSSQGHDFFTDLSPLEKEELIEYLKTI